MIILDDDCRFMTCFDVLSCDEIFSSCHDFQIHPSYSNWFENGLRACIITLIWNLFACFLWNQMKQFLKYDFLNSPASLLKSLFCMLTCERDYSMINFVSTCFFKPSLLLKSLCILTWELRSSRFILRWKEMKPFLQYNFFSNSHYFWNPLFACLFAKYVAGGLFDERNEGSFFTWGVRFTHNRMTCKLSTRRFYPERPGPALGAWNRLLYTRLVSKT